MSPLPLAVCAKTRSDLVIVQMYQAATRGRPSAITSKPTNAHWSESSRPTRKDLPASLSRTSLTGSYPLGKEMHSCPPTLQLSLGHGPSRSKPNQKSSDAYRVNDDSGSNDSEGGEIHTLNSASESPFNRGRSSCVRNGAPCPGPTPRTFLRASLSARRRHQSLPLEA